MDSEGNLDIYGIRLLFFCEPMLAIMIRRRHHLMSKHRTDSLIGFVLVTTEQAKLGISSEVRFLRCVLPRHNKANYVDQKIRPCSAFPTPPVKGKSGLFGLQHSCFHNVAADKMQNIRLKRAP